MVLVPGWSGINNPMRLWASYVPPIGVFDYSVIVTIPRQNWSSPHIDSDLEGLSRVAIFGTPEEMSDTFPRHSRRSEPKVLSDSCSPVEVALGGRGQHPKDVI